MNIELEKLLQFISNENQNKNLKIESAYTIFFNYLKEFKRYITYKYHFAYYSSTINFFKINNIEYTNQIDTQCLLKYIAWCKGNKNKNTTINKKIGSIKYMLNYLYKNDLISKPNIKIDKLQNDEQRFKIIDKENLIKILNHINNYQLNMKLQIILLIATGIRRTELANIQINNINYINNSILLTHTKNGKPRNIYLDNEIMQLIKEQTKNNKIFLFENENHMDHINPDNISNTIKKLKKDLNFENLSPHMFRHTYATTLLENGADIESIRLLLGHSDYSMIQKYVHIKEKRLADISTSLNPIKL